MLVFKMNFKKSLKKIMKKASKQKTKQAEKQDYGLKEEARDWAVSFLVAAVVYFLILPIFLHTTSPLVVVSSCSEKGFLDIGDILVIQGVSAKDVKAPAIQSSNLNFIALNDSGSPYTYRDFEEGYEVKKLLIGSQTVSLNKSNDIIVYNTKPFIGQVIHRAFAKIKKGNKYYIITKGDANLVPDQLGFNAFDKQQNCLTENPGNCISTLVDENMIVGKKILFRIPLLGHVKLFFCDVMPFCEGHSNVGTNHVYKLSC